MFSKRKERKRKIFFFVFLNRREKKGKMSFLQIYPSKYNFYNGREGSFVILIISIIFLISFNFLSFPFLPYLGGKFLEENLPLFLGVIHYMGTLWALSRKIHFWEIRIFILIFVTCQTILLLRCLKENLHP